MPVAEDDDLIRLSLWSRNRADAPRAVVSHELAVVLHELTELLPDRVRPTVPAGFRKELPWGCILHKAALTPAESEVRIEFRVTTPLRTLLDVGAGTTSGEQVEKAVAEALRRGLIRWRELTEAIRSIRGRTASRGPWAGIVDRRFHRKAGRSCRSDSARRSSVISRNAQAGDTAMRPWG